MNITLFEERFERHCYDILAVYILANTNRQ